MKEVWKDIKGYEGLYQVSNIGNVRSLNYRAHKGVVKQLTPKKNNSGRLWVELYKNGKSKQYLIHRLVGNEFIPNPHNYPEINHKDENTENNNIENLEWCSRKYNVQYYCNRHSGEKAKRHGKLTDIRIIQLRNDGTIVKEWKNVRTIYLETKMSASSITECCNGTRKTAYGFKWQYAI